MQKNRLFVKIYLWFWLTTLVLLLTMLVIDLMTQSNRAKEHLRHFVGPVLVLQGQQSVNIFENEDISLFQKFIKHMERPTGFRIYVFDSQGKEITGSNVPQDIYVHITEAIKDEMTDKVISGNKNLVLKTINSQKMKKYLIVAEVPRLPVDLPPPLGKLLLPRLRTEDRTGNVHKSVPQGGFPPPPPGPEDGISFLLLRIAVILIVSGIICYLLARYLTEPIVKLSKATRHFAAGDFSVRVNSEIGKRKDEIANLAIDFDHMAERIESLLTSQRKLLRDISHELRSPLARLNVALELCRQRSDGEALKYLKRIGQESEKLNELIEQILTLNKVDSGIAEFKKEKIDLFHLVNQIASDADFEARNLNRAVKIVFNEKCAIMGNSELIKRAIENIVRNAVLYTVPGSTVEVSLSSSQREGSLYAAIKVRDYGPGVPEDKIENIFKPFYRIDEDRDRKTGGTGIGLAIADAAIKLHKGVIKAENVPGGGLSVEIFLPID